MSYNQEHIATKDLHPTLRAAFRGYRKRKVRLDIREGQPVTVSHNPESCGGTRSDETFFAWSRNDWVQISREEAGSTVPRRMTDGRVIERYGMVWTETTLHDNVISVSTGMFCGKTATMSIDGNEWVIKHVTKEG